MYQQVSAQVNPNIGSNSNTANYVNLRSRLRKIIPGNHIADGLTYLFQYKLSTKQKQDFIKILQDNSQ